jgi:hypothetical protein
MLQRLVTSGREVLVWGESGGGLNHVLESLRLFERSLRPSSHPKGGGGGALQYERFVASGGRGDLWVANMNPRPQHILDTYRTMFDKLYGAPARELGFGRWGVKEVRGTAVCTRLLRLLFPDARFVFLIRNPLACLRSIKQRHYLFSDNWGARVETDQLLHFARNWAKLATIYAKDKSGLHLRYEDLTTGGASLGAIADFLEVRPFDAKFMGESRADWPAISPELALSESETAMVTPILADAMRVWGYERTPSGS